MSKPKEWKDPNDPKRRRWFCAHGVAFGCTKDLTSKRATNAIQLWAVVMHINNEASRLLTGKTINVRQVANRGDVWDKCGLSLAVYATKREALEDARELRTVWGRPAIIEVVRLTEARSRGIE